MKTRTGDVITVCVGGCGSVKLVAFGMCRMHYKRWYTRGDVGIPGREKCIPFTPCRVAGCSRLRSAFGLCEAHYARDRRKCTRDWLAGIKIASSCVDCGYNKHPAALHFDHVRGEKKFDMARCRNYSDADIKAELEKCEVRCANCHAERSYERGQYNSVKRVAI